MAASHVGSWEPTGKRTGALTVLFHTMDAEGLVQAVTIRADAKVSADDQNLTATYTLEFSSPDGTSTGQVGPGTATGTRIAVEPMGEPVAPLAPDEEPRSQSRGKSRCSVRGRCRRRDPAGIRRAPRRGLGRGWRGPLHRHERGPERHARVRDRSAPTWRRRAANDPDGAVDEEGGGITVIGEIEPFAPGQTMNASFDLEPGSYVFVCNVVEDEDGETESHYQNGMRAAFTVS